jgi:hypothetical protein
MSLKDLQEALDNFPKEEDYNGVHEWSQRVYAWRLNFSVLFRLSNLQYLTIYKPEIEKLKKELNEANLLCELQGSRISGLETFKKQCDGKVLADRKQVSEALKQFEEHAGDYDSETGFFQREDWERLKELLEGSDSLSPEEIRDIEASEKEIAEGKGKVFENAEDFIADLQKGRKKGSGCDKLK